MKIDRVKSLDSLKNYRRSISQTRTRTSEQTMSLGLKLQAVNALIGMLSDDASWKPTEDFLVDYASHFRIDSRLFMEGA